MRLVVRSEIVYEIPHRTRDCVALFGRIEGNSVLQSNKHVFYFGVRSVVNDDYRKLIRLQTLTELVM